MENTKDMELNKDFGLELIFGNDYEGQNTDITNNAENECDNCYAGIDCLEHIDSKPPNYKSCYVPLDNRNEECDDCEDPIFDKDFNHGLYLFTLLRLDC